MWPSTGNTKSQPNKKSIAARATLSGFGTELNHHTLETTKFIVTLKPIRKSQDVNDSKSQTTSQVLCQCESKKRRSDDKLSMKEEDVRKEKTILNTFRLLANSKFISIDSNESKDAKVLLPPTSQMQNSAENTAQTRNDEITNRIHEYRQSSSRKLEIKEHINFVTRTPIKVSSDKANQANLCSDSNLENLKKMIMERIRKNQEQKILDDLRKRESKYKSNEGNQEQDTKINDAEQEEHQCSQYQNQQQQQQVKTTNLTQAQVAKSPRSNTRNLHDFSQSRQKTSPNLNVQKSNPIHRVKNPPNPKDYLTKAQNMRRNDKKLRSQSESPHPQSSIRRWSKESTGKNLMQSNDGFKGSYIIPKTLTSPNLNHNRKSSSVEPQPDRHQNKMQQSKQNHIRAISHDRSAIRDLRQGCYPFVVTNSTPIQNLSQAEKNQNHNESLAKSQIFNKNQSHTLNHHDTSSQYHNHSANSNETQNSKQTWNHISIQEPTNKLNQNQTLAQGQNINLNSMYKPSLSQNQNSNLNPILKSTLSQNHNQSNDQNYGQKGNDIQNLSSNFNQNQSQIQNSSAIKSNFHNNFVNSLSPLNSGATAKTIQKPFPYLTRKNHYPYQSRIANDVPTRPLNLNLTSKRNSSQARTTSPSENYRSNLRNPKVSVKQDRATHSIGYKSQSHTLSTVHTKNPELNIAEGFQCQNEGMALRQSQPIFDLKIQNSSTYDLCNTKTNSCEFQDKNNEMSYNTAEADDGDKGSAFDSDKTGSSDQTEKVDNDAIDGDIEENDYADDDDDDESERLTGGAEPRRPSQDRRAASQSFDGSFRSAYSQSPSRVQPMNQNQRECLRHLHDNPPEPRRTSQLLRKDDIPQKDKYKEREKEKKAKEKEKERERKELEKEKREHEKKEQERAKLKAKEKEIREKEKAKLKEKAKKEKKVSIVHEKQCCNRRCATRLKVSQHQNFIDKHGGGPACDRIALLEDQLKQLRYDLSGIRSDNNPQGANKERFELLDRRMMELNFLITDMKMSCGANMSKFPENSRSTLLSKRSSLGARSAVSEQRSSVQPRLSHDRNRTAYLPGSNDMRHRGGGTKSAHDNVSGKDNAQKKKKSDIFHDSSDDCSADEEQGEEEEEVEEEVEEEENLEPAPFKCEVCHCTSDLDAPTKLANCIFIRTKKCTCDKCNCRDLFEQNKDLCYMLPENYPDEYDAAIEEEDDERMLMEKDLENKTDEEVATEGACRCNEEPKEDPPIKVCEPTPVEVKEELNCVCQDDNKQSSSRQSGSRSGPGTGRASDGTIGKDTSFCRYCLNSNNPVVDNNDLCVEVMRRIGHHCVNEIALTILLQANGLYHINIAVIASGEHIACLYATELAIRCANQTNFFADIMTFFIVDSRNTDSEKSQILKHTFEFVNEEKKGC